MKKIALTGAESFWYVLMNIAFGAGYFAKVPAKKALEDFGMTELTGAERFWYILQCVAFGAGYFAKVVHSKALSEIPQFVQARQVSVGQHRLTGPEGPEQLTG